MQITGMLYGARSQAQARTPRRNQLLAPNASSEVAPFIERPPAIALDACSIPSLGGQ
jgi:hypothetical protein